MSELSRGKVPALPLGICVADTEGAIGYMIQQALVNRLQKECINKCVVTVLTQVIVDNDDSAFENPARPIGPFYYVKESDKLINENGWKMVEGSKEDIEELLRLPGLSGSQKRSL